MKRLYNRNLTRYPDEECIRAYRDRHDLEMLGYLFERYIELIFGVCVKYLSDPVESEDATMEIFEVLMQKLKTHEVSHFKGWLYVVVKNHCLQILRKRNAGLTEHLQPDIMHSHMDMHPDSAEALDWKEDGLRDCLDRLPALQKQSIELFYLKSKSYQQIAHEMVLDKEQVRSHIQNGRRNLKNCMEKTEKQNLSNQRDRS